MRKDAAALSEDEKKQRRDRRITRLRDNPVWILFVFLTVFIFPVCYILIFPYYRLIDALQPRMSSGVYFVLDIYTVCIVEVIFLFLLTWIFKRNRYIWKSFLPPRKPGAACTDPDDVAAELYGRSHNRLKMLGWGLLLGFVTNFIPICCALIHGDIKLYFEASPRQIPLFLFALVSVFIQSSSEELWCRGFLYERFHARYPLWVAIVVNGVLFGVLHVFNDGASVLSVVMIAVSGISYSLLRWYSGSIWIVIGAHTAWNFTQNILFGLPNSGIVSELSLFHLDASTGINNLIYDFTFGVEGGLPAFFMDLLLGVVCFLLAAKAGRLKELGWNRPRAIEMNAGPHDAIDSRPE